MEEKSSARFSEYLFAKMDGQDVSASQGPRKVTADTRKFMRENLLLIVTLSGVLFGVVLGFGLRPLGLGDDAVMLISYPGELFMRLLKLMILPLVIASLISGSASLNARMNGMIAVRTLVYFILSSLLNAVLGVVLVLLIHPGNPGIRKSIATSHNGRAVNILDSLLDLGRNMFPDNIFQAAFQQAHTVYVPKTPPFQNLTSVSISSDPVIGDEELMRVTQYRSGTNTLGIVFFCLVFGTFLGTLGEKGQIVIDFFKAVFEVIMRMVSTVMWMTPVGITSVIAGKILGVADLALVMSQLAWFIVTIVIGVFFYQLVIMQLIYLAFVRKNPFKFYAGLAQGTLTAFAMASTAAALPVTFRLMTDKLRVDPRVTRFVLPIGCNINMDGTALFVAVASIFIAQMHGIALGFGEIITVILTSTAASVSSASVPSAALVLLLVVLSAINAPVYNVSLLFTIDWFVDRIRTTNNMLGDCYAAAVVEQLSKKELMALDAAAYQSETVLPTTIANGCISANRVPDPDTIVVEMQDDTRIAGVANISVLQIPRSVTEETV
ncbi:excitatory amino acid transporter isoform X3 [Apis mellifera caucasica]|uniref:Amino acid transporter n=3 Tax=Apis TaxID=7459 RepID=A0A7M7IFL4_APIME|nr:excitatory amino acid transporter isoform X3 [Apis mellifera]KAG6798750.1 excitatory amino acid transporter isoform X3 [Apis mellifera caucasica]KAG9432808.1 excitatory amino acid transporter isoform X3 [Apis mellifera carnica]|eukprot:XP_016767223.1 excitatory amino acid transporter isoform X3 [Apis mellifera]